MSDQSDPQYVQDVQFLSSILKGPDLFGRGEARETLLVELRKALLTVEGKSNQAQGQGLQPHPFNYDSVRNFKDFNPQHAACIEAKRNCTVGLGWKDEDVADQLDQLCDFSISDLMLNFAEDYWETGNGFIEVVYGTDDPNLITGLHHLPAKTAQVFVEDRDNISQWHYEIISPEESSGIRRFARFGDLVGLRERIGDPNAPARSRGGVAAVPAGEIRSEVIHWRMPSGRSRYYGYPEYFGAVPWIELAQTATQHEFNRFFNNGVPEFLLFILGKKLDKATWDSLVGMMKAHQGVTNSHKSSAVNIGDPDVTIQLEKLAMEGREGDGFETTMGLAATNVVTAHGVPPLLAGVVLPGKIGAANEGPNALMIFQVLKIAPAQRALSRLFASTLASPGKKIRLLDGGSVALKPEQFLGPKEQPRPTMPQGGTPLMKALPPQLDPMQAMSGMPKKGHGNGFRTIQDELDLQAMDTVARMREPVATSGRDPKDGLLDGADDRKADDPRKTR